LSGRVNDLGRRQILAAATQALQNADALGVIPTPLDDLGEAIGVEDVIDISQLPEEFVVNKPSALKKLLGAYLFRTDTAFIDFAQPKGRARFVQAHELGHRIIPWHEGTYLDDERRLFRETVELLELEANLAGAHIIFQGRPFFERALEYPNSLKTPILLANIFNASLHATVRYYVEHHPDPLAVIIAGRYTRMDGTVPIFLALESQTFRERLGAIAGRFPEWSLPLNEDARPLGSLLIQARSTVDPPSREVIIRDLAKQQRQFVAEAFFNQRCYFVMFTPATRLRLGRQIEVAS
jgi:hypothetical protein